MIVDRSIIINPVLGAICGDMIGFPYELYCKKGLQINKDFKLWTDDSRFSDDTVMTLAVAKWLLTSRDPKDLVKVMKELGNKYRDAGYGYMFAKWLEEDDPQPYGSFGNGSAMRVSPVGCVFDDNILTLAKISASVSHNHPQGVLGAQAVAWSIDTFYMEEFHSIYDYVTEFKMKFPSYNIDRTPEEIKKSGYRFDSTCQGSVPEAICCFVNSISYEDAVRNAVWLRGDADTQAAIAGSIAAAFYGIPRDIAEEGTDRLPDDLFHILENFSEMYDLEL